MSEVSYENFTFQFEDSREVTLLRTEVLEFSPSFYYQNLNNNDKIIFPLGLTPEDFKTFIEVYQKGNLSLNNNNLMYLEEYTNVVKLLKISEFFKNDSFCFVLINNYFITGEKINQQNALTLLEMSYNKLNELNKDGNLEDNNNEEIDNAWFELFLKCLEIVGDNLLYYFQIGKNKNNNNEIKSEINLSCFDQKIIDEIIEKFSKYLIKNNVTISEKRMSLLTNGEINNITINELELIINYVKNGRGQNNFFDLLTNEYMKICSEENLNDINNLPNPTFLLKIDVNDIENYYEEFVLDNQIDLKNEKKIVLIFFYKKTDDSLNISIKMDCNKGNLNDNNFNILTFVSSVFIEEMKSRQINIKSISNNKSLYSIFKMNNFIRTLNSNSNIEYLTLKIFMKPCYFHSILCCFFMNNFSNLYNEPKISKISKQLFLLLLKNNNFLLNNSSDQILKALLNWLDDEINIREDIINIIEYIKWDNVSLELFLEFILKYGKNISNEELEYIFINSFEKRVENIINFSSNQNISDNIRYFNRNLIKDIISVSKKIDYVNLFYENKKLNKFNNYETSSMLVRNYSTTHTNTQSKVNLIVNKSVNLNNNGSISNKEQDNNIKDEKKSVMSFKDEKKSNMSLKSQGNLKRKSDNKYPTIKRKTVKEKTFGENEREIIFSEGKFNNILGLVEDKKIEAGHNEQKIEIATLKSKSKTKNKIINNQPLMRYMNTTPNQKKNIRKTKSTKNMLRKNSNNKSFVNVNINTNLNISNNYSIYNFENNNQNNPNSHNTNIKLNNNNNNNIVKPKSKSPYLIHTQENKTMKNTHHIKQMSLLNQISRLKLNNKKDDSSKNIRKYNPNNKLKKLNIYNI